MNPSLSTAATNACPGGRGGRGGGGGGSVAFLVPAAATAACLAEAEGMLVGILAAVLLWLRAWLWIQFFVAVLVVEAGSLDV